MNATYRKTAIIRIIAIWYLVLDDFFLLFFPLSHLVWMNQIFWRWFYFCVYLSLDFCGQINVVRSRTTTNTWESFISSWVGSFQAAIGIECGLDHSLDDCRWVHQTANLPCSRMIQSILSCVGIACCVLLLTKIELDTVKVSLWIFSRFAFSK